MKAIAVFTSVILFFSILWSCKKDSKSPVTPAEPSSYSIRMTDGPGPYTAVNVDIQGVEITGSGTTVMLNVNKGIYNLLNFSNGVDTLIATGSLTIDKVEQIRLILGSNNSVATSTGTFQLATPSAQQSGLKLQVHQTLQAGVAYQVLLDFDANQSIVNEGNGSYSLKPVIRTVESALGGSIKGKIATAGVPTTITATLNGTSYSTVANASGDFILAGLPPGAYTVSVTPASPYTASTQNNITVTVGNTTQLGVITI